MPTTVPRVLTLLLLAGCVSPPRYAVLRDALNKLDSPDDRAFSDAFQELTREGRPVTAALRPNLGRGAARGFPAVALMVAFGEGDAVPLDLKARHLARFAWPAEHRGENAVLEPFVWNRLEYEFARTGRAALGVLADALARDAPDEARAMRVVRAMLRVRGRAAADAFAGLLGRERELDGVRVCDLAAAALLYLGRQDALLRIPEPDALLEAARRWWAEAKDRTEEEWTRQALEDLAGRWAPEDPRGVRGVFGLLAGAAVEDPKAWLGSGKPAPSPLRAEALLPRLSGTREEAFDADRRLQAITGTAVAGPRPARVGELRAALRLWQPPRDLEVRWRRHLTGPLLRVTIAAVGDGRADGEPRVILAKEDFFHASEDGITEMGVASMHGSYLLHVQSREHGTRLVYSEYVSTAEGNRGFTREHRGAHPAVLISSALEAAVVMTVDEVTRRHAPRPPELLKAAVAAQLRGLADASEGGTRRRALRALAYLQDPADRERFARHGAAGALLMLGDAAGLEGRPALEPWEVRMALRVAEEAAVRDYLEGLRSGSRP